MPKLTHEALVTLQKAAAHKTQIAHRRLVAVDSSLETKPADHEGVDPRIIDSVTTASGAGRSPRGRIEDLRSVLPNLDRDTSLDASTAYRAVVLVSSPDPEPSVTDAWKAAGFEPQLLSILPCAVTPCSQTAALRLHETGLAIASRDRDQWGISLTLPGHNYYQRSKEHQPEPNKFKSTPIECRVCHEKLLATTRQYTADEPLTGAMLTRYGAAAAGNWTLDFGYNDVGESLVCPGCGSRVCGPDGRLRPGSLMA